MTTLKLGNTVRCAVTGFTGIAIQRSEALSGTVQIAVQPAGKPDDATAMPEAISIDVLLLDFVDDGIAARATPPDPVNLPLGVEVRDLVSGFSGTTVEKITYINGCVRYGVQGKFTPENTVLGELGSPIYFDHKRLLPVTLKDKKALMSGVVSAVRAGLFPASEAPPVTPEPAVEAAAEPKVAKGGPSRRVATRY